MPSFQRGFAPVVLLLVVAGVILGVYLVQNRTNFLPKASEEDEQVTGSNLRDIPEVPEFVANEVLVKVKDLSSRYTSQAIAEGSELAPTGIQALDQVLQKGDAQSFAPLSAYEDTETDGRWYKVTLKNGKPKQDGPKGEITKAQGFYDKDTGVFKDGKGIPFSMTEIVTALKSVPEVIEVEPNYIAYPMAVPNDTFYSRYQWHLPKINMPGAWDVTRGSGVRIAILDTGVNPGIGGIGSVFNYGEWGLDSKGVPKDQNGIDDDGNGEIDDYQGWNFANVGVVSNNMQDSMGHGSFVAGLIAAPTNDLHATAGMVGDGKILPAIVCTVDGCQYEHIAAGIEYAVKTGAKVINMSLGGPVVSALLRDKVKYAWDSGVLVVASAGNSGHKGNPVIYPAAYPNVLSVGATDKSDQKAYFSSYGSWVSVTAPGDLVLSLAQGSGLYLVCAVLIPDRSLADWDKYCFSSGTSFSAPLVSALAALVMSKNPTWINQQVKEKIESTSRKIPGQESYWKYGMVDACKALDCDKFTFTPPEIAESGACPGGVNACGYKDGPPPSKCLNNNWKYVENENSAVYNGWCGQQAKADDPWAGKRAFCYECVTPKCVDINGQCADSEGKNRDKNLSCKVDSFREDASYAKGGCDDKGTGAYPYCYTSCEKVLDPVPRPES